MPKSRDNSKNPENPEPGPELPHDDLAERMVLGAILVQCEDYQLIFDRLTEQDFFDSRHRVIYNHLKKLRDEGHTPNLVNLFDSLQRTS